MKKQPADNKASEDPAASPKVFTGSLTRLVLSSSVLTSMYCISYMFFPQGAKNAFTSAFLDFFPSIMNEYSI